MSEPTPPREVRIKYRNGAVIECPVKYLGYGPWPDGSGDCIHGWQVINEGPFDCREGDELRIGRPPMGGYYIEILGTGPKDDEL